jgi:hypothetical protein
MASRQIAVKRGRDSGACADREFRGPVLRRRLRRRNHDEQKHTGHDRQLSHAHQVSGQEGGNAPDSGSIATRRMSPRRGPPDSGRETRSADGRTCRDFALE